MAYAKIPRIAACFGTALALFGAVPGHAQRARITGLSDVNFATINNFITDQTRAQDVCANTNSPSRRYSVLAQGSGSGFAFTLKSGSATLAYEVQWTDRAGQTTGTNLTANIVSSGFTGINSNLNCRGGNFPDASLITILRSSSLNSARAGTYTGTLTLILAPI